MLSSCSRTPCSTRSTMPHPQCGQTENVMKCIRTLSLGAQCRDLWNHSTHVPEVSNSVVTKSDRGVCWTVNPVNGPLRSIWYVWHGFLSSVTPDTIRKTPLLPAVTNLKLNLATVDEVVGSGARASRSAFARCWQLLYRLLCGCYLHAPRWAKGPVRPPEGAGIQGAS